MPMAHLPPLYRVHVGPQSPVNADFSGYDYVFFVNLSGTTLLNPTLGIGITPQALRISATRKNALGGTTALTALAANQVWVTLVPSYATANISAAFQKGSTGYQITSANLTNNKTLYFAAAPPTASLAGADLQFDGATSVVTVPHNNALNSYPLTVSAWVNTTQTTGGGEIVNKYVSGSLNGWQLFLLNGNVGAFYFGPSGFNQNVWDGDSGTFNGGNIADGKWHNVVFTVDANGGKLYVDGTLKNSLGWTGTPGAAGTTTPLHIGSDGSGFTLNGQIDDVQIWNRALSASDIQNNTNASLSGTESGLLAYYRLDEGKGTTAKDATANHFDGTIGGNPLWLASTAPIDTVNVQYAPRLITLAGFDAGGNPLTFLIKGIPSQGTLLGSSPDFTYTPKLSYSGTDSFTYTANNGGQTSNAATVKVRYGMNTAALAGAVKFQGIVFGAPAQNTLFELRDPNTNLPLHQVTQAVPSSGAYSLANIPLGNYTLWAKGEKWLASTVSVTNDGAKFNVPATPTLRGGDGTNDNVVDIGDFGLLVNAYNSDSTISGSGYDARADFNADGVVDIADFGVLVNNYNQSGAP